MSTLKTLNAWERNPRNVNDSIRRLQRFTANRRERVVYIKDLGGIHYNGSDDDAAVIQSAFDNEWAGDPVCFVFDSGVVLLNSGLTLSRSNVRLVFEDECDIDFSGSDDDTFLTIAGTLDETAFTLAADRGVGRRDLTPNEGTTGWARGDYGFLITDRLWNTGTGDGEEGEIIQVADTSGGRLCFVTRMLGPEYLTSQNARIYKASLLENIKIQGGGRIWGASSYGGDPLGDSVNDVAGGYSHTGIKITNATRVEVSDIALSDFAFSSVEMTNCLHFDVERVKVQNAVSPGSNAYGILTQNACQWGTVRGCRVKNARHAYGHGAGSLAAEFGSGPGITRHVQRIGNEAVGTTSNAFDWHPHSEHCDDIGNHASSSMLHGFLHRGKSGKLIGNTAQDCIESGIKISPEVIFSADFVVADNVVQDIFARPTTLSIGVAGNNLIYLTGERVTQGATVGVVEAYPTPGDVLYVRELSGTFSVAATPVVGAVSGASNHDVTARSVPTFATGIWADGNTNAFNSLIIKGNTINGVGSSAAFQGILIDTAPLTVVTGNVIALPASATGIGISVVDSSNCVVNGNSIWGSGTPTSSTGISESGSSGSNNCRDNEITNVTTIGGHGPFVGTATYDPPNLNTGTGSTTSVTVTGAALGDLVQVSFSLDLQGIDLLCAVSSADTVFVKFQNETGGTINLGSGTLKAIAYKHST